MIINELREPCCHQVEDKQPEDRHLQSPDPTAQSWVQDCGLDSRQGELIEAGVQVLQTHLALQEEQDCDVRVRVHREGPLLVQEDGQEATIPLLGPPGYYTASGAFMGFDSENSSREGELDLERAVAQPAPVRTT